MEKNSNSKPSELKKSKKHHQSSDQDLKKRFQASHIETSLKKATFPMNKKMVVDFFESDIKKLANMDLVDLIDEVDDIMYHSAAQLIDEFKRLFLTKKK